MEFVSAVDWTRPEEEERWREEEVAAAVAGARRQMGEVVGRAEQVLLGKLGKQAGKTAAGGEREGMRGEERERMEEQEAKRARVLREARKAFAALGGFGSVAELFVYTNGCADSGGGGAADDAVTGAQIAAAVETLGLTG
eukprot:63867-Rhodomonas_salina.2